MSTLIYLWFPTSKLVLAGIWLTLRIGLPQQIYVHSKDAYLHIDPTACLCRQLTSWWKRACNAMTLSSNSGANSASSNCNCDKVHETHVFPGNMHALHLADINLNGAIACLEHTGHCVTNKSLCQLLFIYRWMCSAMRSACQWSVYQQSLLHHQLIETETCCSIISSLRTRLRQSTRKWHSQHRRQCGKRETAHLRDMWNRIGLDHAMKKQTLIQDMSDNLFANDFW